MNMTWVIVLSILACVGMIVLTLIKPKIKIKKFELSTYWLIPLLVAIIMIASGLISIDEVWHGLNADNDINPLKILIIFLSMTILSIFLDETGFFKWLATIVTEKAGSSQLKLWSILFLTTTFITIFTSNDIVILTLTPFICYFCKNAKIKPLPYLIASFVAANTMSMLLIIGNPTNIYIAGSHGIDFMQYLAIMVIPSVLSTIVSYLVMFLVFRKQLKEPIEPVDQAYILDKKALMIMSLIVLIIATITLAISAYINLAMWVIALGALATLIIITSIYYIVKRSPPKELLSSLKRTPYELIPFILSMFVLVLVLDKFEVTNWLGTMHGENVPILVYGVSSFLFANLVNNIPMSVLFTTILLGTNTGLPGIFAVVIGSNIGALLTPFGSLAGIMWISILKKHEIKFNVLQFIKYGVIIAFPILLAALGGLGLALLLT